MKHQNVKRKATVLFITRKYPPSIGGMQKLSFQLATELSKHLTVNVIAWHRSQLLLPFFLIQAFFKAKHLLNRDNSTVILLGDSLLAPLGLLLKKSYEVPVIATSHGLDIAFPNYLYQKMICSSLTKLDFVICNSNHTKNNWIKRGGDFSKCNTIYPGIDAGNYIYFLYDDKKSN